MAACCNHDCNQGRTCPVRCEEAARVAADLRINELKNTGEVHRREADRALQLLSLIHI